MLPGDPDSDFGHGESNGKSTWTIKGSLCSFRGLKEEYLGGLPRTTNVPQKGPLCVTCLVSFVRGLGFSRY